MITNLAGLPTHLWPIKTTPTDPFLPISLSLSPTSVTSQVRKLVTASCCRHFIQSQLFDVFATTYQFACRTIARVHDTFDLDAAIVGMPGRDSAVVAASQGSRH